MFENFLRPLTTGDVWWQDGQIKEEEGGLCYDVTKSQAASCIHLQFQNRRFRFVKM